ncbi:MAG: hypothetical protein U9Q66_01635 [Patescibacteria group bacterium]|nr:hypothetical protein [Patescibacteria group bacterium]
MADLPVSDAIEFFNNIVLNEYEEKIAKKVLKNVIDRLEFMS